jgi:CDP-diacylglycerol--serine O-phosphatidyltransferase
MYYLLDGALGVEHPMLAGAALLIPVFSALRLAKFNIDTRQSYSFIGLPTPANALLIGSLPFIVDEIGGLSAFFAHPLVLIGITIVFSLLLVSEVPLLAMKFQNYSWASNQTRYTFLLISVLLLVLLRVKAIPFIIVIYIALSVFDARSFVYREPKEQKR